MKSISKYTQAFVHRSYVNEHPGKQSNERLEFLGDSVLSLVISNRLYKLFPDLPEGQLTARRSYLVQTTTLAERAKDLGLDKHLLLSAGEEQSGGRTNTGLLANTFEAVLGAMYLDDGLSACEEYLLEIFPDSELLNLAPSQVKDSKSLLQERAQSQNLGTPFYKVLSAEGPDHARKFTVAVSVNGKQLATGQGTSKQRAEAAAATAAVAVI
ncbi:MAG: ribonuclease III [Patescibacteria group bacterium]